MLKMRLQRVGRRNNPSYRVLVVDSHQGPKSGKFIDNLGSYDPKSDRITLNGEKAKEWIAKGVQTSGTVHNILITQGVIEGKKLNVLPRKSPIKKEGEEDTEVASAEDTKEVKEDMPTPEVEEVSEIAPAKEAPAAEEVPEVAEASQEESEDEEK